jgi:hypothetical protein
MFQVGTHLWNIGAAASGCFAFMRGYSMVALARQAKDIAAPICDVVPFRKSFAVSLPHESIWPLSWIKGWQRF